MAQRTTSTTAQVAAAQNALRVYDWPEMCGECTEATWLIFCENQKQRAYDDWTPSDLIELAKVSRIQAMVMFELDKLETEGVIVYGGKTGLVPMENPRNRAISTLNSTITSTMRRLGMTSMSVEDKRSRANRGKQERDATPEENEPAQSARRSLI